MRVLLSVIKTTYMLALSVDIPDEGPRNSLVFIMPSFYSLKCEVDTEDGEVYQVSQWPVARCGSVDSGLGRGERGFDHKSPRTRGLAHLGYRHRPCPPAQPPSHPFHHSTLILSHHFLCNDLSLQETACSALSCP